MTASAQATTIAKAATKKACKGKPRAGHGITWNCCPLGADGGHRAGVYACPAVDAGISSDSPLVAGFADCVNRAGIVACAAVDAFVRNCM